MAWPPDPDNRFSPAEPDGGDDVPDDGADDAPDDGADDAPDDVADAFARFAADARVDERVAERRRLRWLQRQVVECSSFAGLLENLAESGDTVHVLLDTGASHRGSVAVLGSDVLALQEVRTNRLVVLPLHHVAAVDTSAAPAVSGERAPRRDAPSLHDLLSELAEELPPCHCTLAGGAAMQGRLLWVGDDLLAVDVEQRRRYVRLSSLVEVSVSVSG